MTIKLIVKDAYGTSRFYPNCDLSRRLCYLLQTKTIPEEWVSFMKDLGIDVDIKPFVKG